MRKRRTVSVLQNLYNIDVESAENLNNFISKRNTSVNNNINKWSQSEKISNENISNIYSHNSGIRKSGYRGESAVVIESSIVINSNIAYDSAVYSANVNEAYNKLVNDLVKTGNKYINNTASQRAGYMAENFVADTYNLDAAIKNIGDKARPPGSHVKNSADILYDSGKSEASLKYYSTPEKSVNAQLDPGYGKQQRVIPSDQLKQGQDYLSNKAYKNRLEGRSAAADHQDKVNGLLTDRIRGSAGAESTPLSRKEALELANAIGRDKNGNSCIDKNQIKDLLKTQKNEGGESVYAEKIKAGLKKEATGLGISILAAASISAAVYLWFNRDNLSWKGFLTAAGKGVAIGGGTYGVGRVVSNFVKSPIQVQTISGCVLVAIFSVYNFYDLKKRGFSTGRSLKMTLVDVTLPSAGGVAGMFIGANLGKNFGPHGVVIGGIVGGMLGTMGMCKGISWFQNNEYRELLDKIDVYEMEIMGTKIFEYYNNNEYKYEDKNAFAFM